MDTMGAIRFNLPMAIVHNAIVPEKRTPRRGLSDAPTPFAKGFKNGNMRSPDKDWSMRGAPKKEAMAEDSVAAITPATIKKSTTATCCMEL